MEQRLDELRRVPLFARCSARHLESVAERMRDFTAEVGAQLAIQGVPTDTFHIIVEGEAEVTVDGRPRRKLGPRSFFGEISLLDGGPASATVTVTRTMHTFAMSRTEFQEAIAGNPEFVLQLLGTMALRLRGDDLAPAASDGEPESPTHA